MYCRFYNIKHEPFATTADPSYFFASQTHKNALDRLLMTVTKRRGITAIIGEPGLGKSTLLRAMLDRLEQSVNFAWVFNTTMEPSELLKYICRDFGFSPKSDHKSDLLIELYTFFVREYEQNRLPLLIIDEAQNLTVDGLEEIRQLSNLETVNNKLLQIILCGQPQLENKLALPQMIQLKQRINFTAVLSRLTCEETSAYILHRLTVAGAENATLFSDAALKQIYEFSGGIPRLINQLCDDALHTAAQQNATQVDRTIIFQLLQNGNVAKAPLLETSIGSQPNQPVKKPIPQKPVEKSSKVKVSSQRRIIETKYDFFEAIDLTELLSLI